VSLSRVIYAVDIGSTRCKAGQTPNFAWARVDTVDPRSVVGSCDITKLTDRIVRDLQNRKSVALGFEAPLFIPVPAEPSLLSWPPGHEQKDSPLLETIAEAARELVAKRDAWLNPPDATEAELKKRTLTNLYNALPAWLAEAHRKLDEAVFAAYGWPSTLTDAELLEQLLRLNHERAA